MIRTSSTFLTAIAIACCLTFQSDARAQATPARDEIAKQAPQITADLRSRDPAVQSKALDTIRDIAKTQPRALADNLPQWLDLLLAAKKYEDLESLALIAINEKAFDIATVQTVQKARVQAWMDQQKYDRALIEAKGFYNVCVLKDMDVAIKLLEDIWIKSGDTAAALRFTTEQMAPSEPTASTTKPREVPEFQTIPIEGVDNALKTIKVDPAPYAAALAQLEVRGARSAAVSNLAARGNLLLLSDRPFDARQMFEAACKIQGNSAKNMRESVEGVARAIKSQSGSPAMGNAFIVTMREKASGALIPAPDTMDTAAVRTAAQQTVLAPTGVGTVPAVEAARSKEESLSSAARGAAPRFGTNVETGSKLLRGRWLSPSHLEVELSRDGERGWFMLNFTGVKGRTIRIDFKDYQPLVNWGSFNPVYSYVTDLASPDAYLPSETKPSLTTAFNGSRLPEFAAQKWFYVKDTWRISSTTMACVVHFDEDAVHLAMRVPYPPSLNEAYLRKLASNPSLKITEVGKSKQGRPLLMAQVGAANDADRATKPCTLIYAGEHADEYDAMWAAYGAIEFLAGPGQQAKQLRENESFLIIPILDPDAASAGSHSGMYRGFVTGEQTPESIAYSNWFQQYVNSGNRLDLVYDLHNVQSQESGHVACALIEGVGERGELSMQLNSFFVDQLQSSSLSVNPTPWQRGWSPDRFGGWLSRRYGPLCLSYELNSQAQDRHLTSTQVQLIGNAIVLSVDKFLATENRAKLMSNVNARRGERQFRWSSAGTIPAGLDAIAAEALVSKGVGIDGANAEKWVP